MKHALAIAVIGMSALLAGCATAGYGSAYQPPVHQQRYVHQQAAPTAQDRIRGARNTGCQLWSAVGQVNTWNNSTYSYACYVPAILGY